MKKVLILVLFFLISFAKNNSNTMNYKKYENYINEILNYKVELKPLTYNPFYIPVVQKKKEEQEIIKNKKIVKHHFTPKPTIKILTILNNKVYLLLKERGKTKRTWLNVGEKVGDFKLIKILKEAVLVKYRNKFKIVRLNKKIENFHLKVTQ